jgi:cytochrome b involved in lipid metabolism
MGSDQKQSHGKVVEEKLIVAYKSELYDITEFIYKHPGGVNTLFNKNQKDIEKSFRDADHSKAAEYLLQEYKLKSENKFDERLEVKKFCFINLAQINKCSFHTAFS